MGHPCWLKFLPDPVKPNIPMITKAEPISAVRWEDLAPEDHIVQIYAEEEGLLDAMEAFVSGGLKTGESVIVISISRHLNDLEDRLYQRGVNLNLAIAQHQYLPIDAHEALNQFLVNGLPDQAKFEQVVDRILSRARRGGRKVRAFGEMVAIMWGRGERPGTIMLERLWNELRAKDSFPLFCAYPTSDFEGDSRTLVECVCSTHTRALSGDRNPRRRIGAPRGVA